MCTTPKEIPMTIRQRSFFLLICLMFTLIANISPGQSLTNVVFVAFDTETTGLDARSGRVIEIGAVKFQNGKVLAATNWLINPEMPIPTNSQNMHHITDAMVADKPKMKQVLPEFIAFIKDATLMAHNAQFDLKFMRVELRKCGLPPPENNVIDTLKLSRLWFPETKSHELDKLVEYLKLPEGTFHRSLADAKHAMDIFLVGIGKLPGDATLEDVMELTGGALKFTAPKPKQPHSFKSAEPSGP
jgi:DNA polymerase III epsilon subunit family exonuclease